MTPHIVTTSLLAYAACCDLRGRGGWGSHVRQDDHNQFHLCKRCLSCFGLLVVQGIVLVSPGIDGERNLTLSILEKLQSIALIICPNARIVPSPPFDKCINVPELVSHFQPLLSLVGG